MLSRSMPLAGALALVISAGATAQNQPVEQRGAPAVPAPPKQSSTTVAPTTTVPEQTTPSASAPGQTQSSPGQVQTAPGQASDLTPAVTGQTPSGQATGEAQAGQLRAATAADVKAGVSVYDEKGAVVGKIDSVSSAGAVVDTGAARATIPVSSFAKGGKGLVISMTKAQLDASAKTRTRKKPK